MHVELRWHKAGGARVVVQLLVGSEPQYAEKVATLSLHPTQLNAIDRLLSDGARAQGASVTYSSRPLVAGEE